MEERRKVYVEVRARHLTDGTCRPETIKFENDEVCRTGKDGKSSARLGDTVATRRLNKSKLNNGETTVRLR